MTEKSFDKVIVALCEGQHDVSFLSRILLVNGFNLDNKKLSQLPFPFDNRFTAELSEVRIPDKKLGFQPMGPNLPSMSFTKDGTLVFIHNLNGDGKHRERENLVSMYRELSGEDDFSTLIPYRFLYFFDADDIGIENRLNEVRREIGCPVETEFSNGSLFEFDGVEWGGYIFHEHETQYGTLEDLLLKHFDNKVASLKSNIITFLGANVLSPNSTKLFVYEQGAETYKGRSKYYEKKSILGIFGQLQFSGVSNAVMINQTDFLKAADIIGCQQCLLINSLFS